MFVGLARIEVPGLGIGHFLYIPIAAIALATGPLWGAAAGALSAALYVTASALNSDFEQGGWSLSMGGLVLTFTFMAVGWIVGAGASRNRELMDRPRTTPSATPPIC